MPVSQGKVRGVCRVVLSLQEAAAIQVKDFSNILRSIKSERKYF